MATSSRRLFCAGPVGVSCDRADPEPGAPNVISYGEPIEVCSDSVAGSAEVYSSVVGPIAARQDAVSVTGWSPHSGDGMEIVGVALMPSTAGGGVGLTGFPPDVFTELDVEFQWLAASRQSSRRRPRRPTRPSRPTQLSSARRRRVPPRGRAFERPPRWLGSCCCGPGRGRGSCQPHIEAVHDDRSLSRPVAAECIPDRREDVTTPATRRVPPARLDHPGRPGSVDPNDRPSSR